MLIRAGTHGLAVWLLGRGWPVAHFGRVTAVTLGRAYTIFSQGLNVAARRGAAHRDLMPTLPVLGTGLSPLRHWVMVPGAALA